MKRLIYAMAACLLLAGSARANEMHYVIQVTPALVYVDAGETAGVQEGDAFAVLREAGKGRYARVAEVRVVRVAEAFCIAEIVSMVQGEEVEVLHRVLSLDLWESMEGSMPKVEEEPAGPFPRRSFYLLGGGDWSKGVDLVWDARTDRLVAVRNVGDLSVGLRLGRAFADKWRINLTYRMAGEMLGAGDVDVTHLGMELDLHYLFRGMGRSGLYIGAGAGVHQLSWDAPGTNEESTTKTGINLMSGLEFPQAMGRTNLLFEVGYQYVLKWDALIDVSNVRGFIGLGRNF